MADKNKANELFERQIQNWKMFSKEAGDATSVYLANYLSSAADLLEIRYNLLYGRGPLVLHTIRQHLKEKHGEEGPEID